MNIKFRKDAKLKTGTVINYGTKATGKFVTIIGEQTGTEYNAIEVTISEGTEVSAGNVLDQDLVFRTRKFSTFFQPPTVRTMHRWNDAGIARTVTGKKCEPDGYGPDGSPSWLLVLGMI